MTLNASERALIKLLSTRDDGVPGVRSLHFNQLPAFPNVSTLAVLGGLIDKARVRWIRARKPVLLSLTSSAIKSRDLFGLTELGEIDARRLGYLPP